MTERIVGRALARIAAGEPTEAVVADAVAEAYELGRRGGRLTLAEAARRAGVSLRRAQQLAAWMEARGGRFERDGRRIVVGEDFVLELRRRRRHGDQGTSGPPDAE